MPNNDEKGDEILKSKDFVEEKPKEKDPNDDKGGEGSSGDTSKKEGEGSDENVKTQEELEAEKKAEELHKRNEEQKAKRLAKEKEKREQEIRNKAILETQLEMVKVNPYTNEKIVDEEDLKIYKIQKQLEEDGKDPIDDLPKKIAELNRLENKKRADEQEKQNKLQKEAEELYQAYPEARGKAENDEELLNLLVEKNGRWTMKECYDYLLVQRSADEKAQAKKKEADEEGQAVSKQATRFSSPPSSQGGYKAPKDVGKMTKEEFEKYFEEKYGG